MLKLVYSQKSRVQKLICISLEIVHMTLKNWLTSLSLIFNKKPCTAVQQTHIYHIIVPYFLLYKSM